MNLQFILVYFTRNTACDEAIKAATVRSSWRRATAAEECEFNLAFPGWMERDRLDREARGILMYPIIVVETATKRSAA